MKECALCSQNIDHVKEPALLFIGKYGRRYEICLDCEEVMDTLVNPSFDTEREEAAKKIYGYLFEKTDETVSSEMIGFFRDLLTEDSELMTEARENLEEYNAEEEKKRLEAEEAAKKALLAAEEEMGEALDAVISEEDFIKDETKPLSLGTRLLFFALFTLLAGGAVLYGVLQSNVVSIVIGAIVFLLGTFTSFSKE